MKIKFLLLALLCMVCFLPVASAEQVPVLVYDDKIVADAYVNPIDFSFFEEAQAGKLELNNVKNLWGAGATLVIYVNTEKGLDYLRFKFDGPMIQAHLSYKDMTLLANTLKKVNSTGISVTIKDDALTISMGGKSRTIQGVYSFAGKGTTQSITADAKAYIFKNEAQ